MLSARREKQFHQTHKLPVPRFGGLAFSRRVRVIAPIAIVFSASREGIGLSLSLVFTSLAMFGLGFWDDISPLGAKKKLLGQIVHRHPSRSTADSKIETFKNPFSGEIYALGPWHCPTTVFWLVALTNLINLVDGIDGLGRGIAVMLNVPAGVCRLSFAVLLVLRGARHGGSARRVFSNTIFPRPESTWAMAERTFSAISSARSRSRIRTRALLPRP
jgi:UDP-N-acetylmuramyl pentapeptide phosphotransferase/UDP-N-acetylglucosamine-1-phosphate transferase